MDIVLYLTLLDVRKYVWTGEGSPPTMTEASPAQIGEGWRVYFVVDQELQAWSHVQLVTDGPQWWLTWGADLQPVRLARRFRPFTGWQYRRWLRTEEQPG